MARPLPRTQFGSRDIACEPVLRFPSARALHSAAKRVPLDQAACRDRRTPRTSGVFCPHHPRHLHARFENEVGHGHRIVGRGRRVDLPAGACPQSAPLPPHGRGCAFAVCRQIPGPGLLGTSDARPLDHPHQSRRRTDVCFVSLHQVPRNHPQIPMKRSIVFVVFFLILGFALAGLYWSQRRPKSTPVSANAILNMAADAQHDLSRIPMHFTRLSDDQEIVIGRELAARYATQTRKLSPEEEGLERYITGVGKTVALHAHRRLPYKFTVLPDHNMINAFSLPGGPVYIGEGMLDLMMSEDELANVLGHEVEHIDHYHCVERVQLEAKLKNLDLDVLGVLLQIPLDFWEAGYHKDEEFEADREGMYLAVQSGYSPYGTVDTFERFAKLCDEYVIHAQSPDQELSELAIQSLSGYFRSHPL